MNLQPHENIFVRTASESDVDSLVEFNAAMAFETEGRNLDQSLLRAGIQAVFQNPLRGRYWVAELQSQDARAVVVGQLLITYEWSDWRNANFWWIQSVYVQPRWRNVGVFRSLYRHVCDQAKTREDVCGVRLYVEQDNADAQAVYRKLGLNVTSYRMMEHDFVLPSRRTHA